MSFAKKLGSKVFDDILGIDPSGQGLVGSIRDNPIIPAALNFIPGIGPVTAGLIGAGGNLLGGAGLSGALRGGLAGYGGGKFLEGFTGAEGTGLFGRLKAGESAMFGGLPGYGAVSSALGPMGANTLYGGLLGAGISGLGRQQQGPQIPPEGFYNIPCMGAGAGAPIGQSAFDYARSIAGGMPFEQVVQPGREFSLEQPMGEPVAPQAQVPAAPVTKLFF